MVDNNNRKKSKPKSKILVSGFIRKDSRGNKKKVAPYYRKDVGAPGKTPESKKTLPKPINDVSLSDMDYSTHKSNTTRKKVLKEASAKYGTLFVLRHLNLRANYQQWIAKQSLRPKSLRNKNTHDKMKSDIEFLSNLHKLSKKNSKKLSRKSSRKSSKKGSKKSSRKGSKKSSKKSNRKGSKKSSKKDNKKISRKGSKLTKKNSSKKNNRKSSRK